jgi:hypothetical protein
MIAPRVRYETSAAPIGCALLLARDCALLLARDCAPSMLDRVRIDPVARGCRMTDQRVRFFVRLPLPLVMGNAITYDKEHPIRSINFDKTARPHIRRR